MECVKAQQGHWKLGNHETKQQDEKPTFRIVCEDRTDTFLSNTQLLYIHIFSAFPLGSMYLGCYVFYTFIIQQGLVAFSFFTAGPDSMSELREIYSILLFFCHRKGDKKNCSRRSSHTLTLYHASLRERFDLFWKKAHLVSC